MSRARMKIRRGWRRCCIAAAMLFTAAGNAFAQPQTITLTADMVTHESFRLSWTPSATTQQIQYVQGFDFGNIVQPGAGAPFASFTSPFTITTTNTLINTADFANARTTPFRFRIADLDPTTFENTAVSNEVMITIAMPDGTGGSVTGNPPAMGGGGGGDDDNKMAGGGVTGNPPDETILPNVLRNTTHGIRRGIFNRIQQRQREDGRWK